MRYFLKRSQRFCLHVSIIYVIPRIKSTVWNIEKYVKLRVFYAYARNWKFLNTLENIDLSNILPYTVRKKNKG